MLENITGNKLFDQLNLRMEGVDDYICLIVPLEDASSRNTLSFPSDTTRVLKLLNIPCPVS